MKDKVINYQMNIIKKNMNFDEVKLAEIKYGLEGIYLMISKLVVIGLLAYWLNLFKELIIFLLLYNIIRSTSFGLHATKSWICLVSSTLIFIGIPLMCKYIFIPSLLKIVLGFVLIYLFYKNAPADTEKRPIVSVKRRKILKCLSVFIVIVLVCCSIFISNNFLSNCLICAPIVQAFMISPAVYKIFGLKYNNYIDYLRNNSI